MATTKPAASRKRTTKPTTARKTTTKRKSVAKKQNPCTCGPGEACGNTQCKGTPLSTQSQVSIGLTPETTDKFAQAPSSQPITYTHEQKQAKLEAYHTLQQAGLQVPAELAQEVEAWVAEMQAAETAAANAQVEHESRVVAKANIEGPWYVRNCYNAPFNFRLDRQTEKRRIELKARGNPGDMHPLKDEDLKDPVLITNVKIGLLEIIPAGEAAIIVDKQTTNMSTRVHTPLAVLQKEYYDHATQHGMQVSPNPQFRMEAEFNSQGVTVAAVDPRVAQGQLHDRQIGGAKGTGGIQRLQPGQEPRFAQPSPTLHSSFVPTGGNPAIISQGPLRQDIAQRAQGLKEATLHPGPDQLTVTVEPTQRT